MTYTTTPELLKTLAPLAVPTPTSASAATTSSSPSMVTSVGVSGTATGTSPPMEMFTGAAAGGLAPAAGMAVVGAAGLAAMFF